ncbi:MAG: hypothetical protein JW820_18130 [Spirochaetales bacterium]|nr:hypothetical protein [Spirochaetales bacterium]
MSFLEPLSEREIELLEDQERALAARLGDLELRYSGLRDLDLWLELIAVRLRIAVMSLEAAPGGHAGDPDEWGRRIHEKALAAVNDLEELRVLDISEDQKSVLKEAPGYAQVRQLLERFVADGGAAWLDERGQDERRTRAVARALAESLRKFVVPEDQYRQVFKTEQLRPLLRRVVGFFWPLLARERQSDPPYGIEEGQEVLLRSERMKMPISQAVYYLENELLPRIEQELDEDPGSAFLQRRRTLVQERIREYKNVRFLPRATPLNLEQGFYTDWLSHYTADGELLVTVDVPVQMMSGTNLDRLREYIQNDLVRRLAGKGVCPDLDADYGYRKSLDSGRRGSSRLPGSKVDYARGFRALRQSFPVLRRLDDRRQLQQLLELVRTEGPRRAREFLEQQASRDRASGLLGPGLLPPSD